MAVRDLLRSLFGLLVAAGLALGSLGCLPPAVPPAAGEVGPTLATATQPAEPTAAPVPPSPTPEPAALPSATPALAATPAPEPTSVAAIPRATPLVSRAEIERIEAGTSEVRQLQPKAEVPVEFLDRPRLRQLMTELFERDYLPEERASDQRLLTTLGYVRPDQDVVELWLDLYEEQVVGLYDDETKRMYVIADRFGAEERITYSHEYIHALQDQYFDLTTLSPDHSDNYDRSLAVHALIEGDATLSMTLYALEKFTQEEMVELARSDSGSSGRLEQMPLIFQRELIFPYANGMDLVRRLHRRGGFQAVDAAFADPPVSTEQVLHLDKYDQREAPIPVDLPDLGPVAGQDWQRLDGNTLGELYLQVLVEQYLDRQEGERAAAGWGGDRWQLLTRGEQSALVLRTVWDSEQEAEEFHTLYGSSLEERFPARSSLGRSPEQLQLSTPDYWVQTTLRGNQVDVVFAPDAATGENLAAWLAANAA